MLLLSITLQVPAQSLTRLALFYRVDGKGGYWYFPFLADWSGGNQGKEKPAYRQVVLHQLCYIPALITLCSDAAVQDANAGPEPHLC